MKVKEYLDFLRLLSAMKTAVHHASPWSGTIFRSAPPRWAAGKDMLTGLGSMKSGARYNAPGSFPAIYGSTTPELAMMESLAYQRRAGLPVDQAMPLVFKAILVKVDRSLDLTASTVLSVFSLAVNDLLSERWWIARARGEESRTQAIGRAAHHYRIQALVVASAHSVAHGNNVVLFPDHIPAGPSVKILRRPRRPA